MFLGDTATAQAASKTSAIPKAKRRRSVHLRLRALVLRYLCQSKVAAMRAADSIMLVAQAVLSPGASSNEKLRLEGLEYLRWSLRNMPSGRSLSLICRNYFKFMLTLVQLYKQQKATKAKKRPAPANVAAALESEKKTEQRVQVSTKLMGAAYAVLGEIVEKSPKLVASSEGILLLFFKALQNEPSEISQQIYDGLICAANAYKSSSAPTKRKIRSILVSMALKGKGEGGSGSDNSMELDGGRGGNAGEETKLMREKLAVVECSNRLFEFTDCEARFVCLALSCNPSFKVRRSCQEGLKPLSKLFAQNSSKSPPIGGGGTQIKQPGPSSEDGNGSGGEKPSKMRRIDKQPGSGDNAPSEDTNGDVKSSSLSTSSTSSSSKIATAKDVIVGYPDFSEMVLVVFTRLQQQQQQQQLPSSSSSASSSSSSSSSPTVLLSDAVMSGCLSFLHLCFNFNAKVRGISAAEMAKALITSEDAKKHNALFTFQRLVELSFHSRSATVVGNAARILVSLVRWAPEQFARQYSVRRGWLKSNLLEGSQETRESMAKLLDSIARYMSQEELRELLDDLMQSSILPCSHPPSKLEDLSVDTGALVGALLGGCVVASELLLSSQAANKPTNDGKMESSSSSSSNTGIELVKRMCASMAVLLSHHSAMVVSQCCKGFQRMGSIGPLPLPEGRWEKEEDDQGGKTEDTTATATKPTKDSSGNEEKEKKKEKKEDDAYWTEKRLRFEAKITSAEAADRCAIFRRLARLSASTVKKNGGRSEARVPEEAVRAIGKIVKGDNRPIWRRRGFDGLISLKNSSHEELHFAVGEALVDVAGGPAGDGMGDILDRILSSHINQGSQIQRASACTWLLCLVKYGGGEGGGGEGGGEKGDKGSSSMIEEKTSKKNGKAVLDRAQRIQKAFSVALTESRQLTQECASKGLAVLYEIGDDKTKEELIDALSHVFKAGTRKVTGDTEIKVGVGSSSSSSSSGGGKMATYAELCTMATDIGQPDLVYEFMDLAAHHSIWNSKSGAAFSLGSILKASERLRPSLEFLIPKLFRYKHDPDPKIRASMEELWNNLMVDRKTGRQRPLEARHFKPILKELLGAMGKSQWRVRQSAATATASLLHGVKAEQIIEELKMIWRMGFRLIDDRKETVRKEGGSIW
eukprot:jgi/Bigna1/147599/aug1.231_g22307